MTDDRRLALDVALAALESSCQVVEQPWGVLVMNPEFPRVHMANFLWLRALPAGDLHEALRWLEDEFTPFGIRDRPVVVEDEGLAGQLAPELAHRGFAAKPEHLMFARKEPSLAANPAVSVRPARDALTRDDHDEVAGLLHEEEGYDHDLSHQMLALHWRRAADLGAEVSVAYVDGQPAGNVGVAAVGGVGQVFEMETAPAYRHRGVAATMMRHVLDRARALGLRLFLQTPVADTTWRMYERLGFVREGTLGVFLWTR